jgi:Retroviral aspartyl protease
LHSQTNEIFCNQKEAIIDMELKKREYENDSFDSFRNKLDLNGRINDFVPKKGYTTENIEIKFENEKLFKIEQIQNQNIRLIEANESPKIVPIILDITETLPNVNNNPNENNEKLAYFPKDDNIKPKVVNLQKYSDVCEYKMIEIKIEENNFTFLIDTGADLSCCSQDVISNSKFFDINFQNRTLIKGVTNDIISTIGTCELKLFDKLNHEFHILPNTYEFHGILGRDFLLKHQAIISFREKKVYLPEHKLQCPFIFEKNETVKTSQRSQTYSFLKCSRLLTYKFIILLIGLMVFAISEKSYKITRYIQSAGIPYEYTGYPKLYNLEIQLSTNEDFAISLPNRLDITNAAKEKTFKFCEPTYVEILCKKSKIILEKLLQFLQNQVDKIDSLVGHKPRLRTRCVWFEGIRTVSKVLFGTMDAEDTTFYSGKLSNFEKTEENLADQLCKNINRQSAFKEPISDYGYSGTTSHKLDQIPKLPNQVDKQRKTVGYKFLTHILCIIIIAFVRYRNYKYPRKKYNYRSFFIKVKQMISITKNLSVETSLPYPYFYLV